MLQHYQLNLPVHRHLVEQQLYRVTRIFDQQVFLMHVFPDEYTDLVRKRLEMLKKGQKIKQGSYEAAYNGMCLIEEVVDENNELHVIYADSGLWTNIGSKVPQEKALELASHIYLVYEYLIKHDQHLDYDFDQIQVHEEQIFIIDYGIQTQVLLQSDNQRYKHYQVYMAPEILHGQLDPNYSPSWSFGIILLTMLTHKNLHQLLRKNIIQGLDLTHIVSQACYQCNVSRQVNQFILKMLRYKNRIAWKDIKEDPLIKMNLGKVQRRYNIYINKQSLTRLIQFRKSPRNITPPNTMPNLMDKTKKKSQDTFNIFRPALKQMPVQQDLHKQRIIENLTSLKFSQLDTRSSQKKNKDRSQYAFAVSKVINNLNHKDQIVSQRKVINNLSEFTQVYNKGNQIQFDDDNKSAASEQLYESKIQTINRKPDGPKLQVIPPRQEISRNFQLHSSQPQTLLQVPKQTNQKMIEKYPDQPKNNPDVKLPSPKQQSDNQKKPNYIASQPPIKLSPNIEQNLQQNQKEKPANLTSINEIENSANESEFINTRNTQITYNTVPDQPNIEDQVEDIPEFDRKSQKKSFDLGNNVEILASSPSISDSSFQQSQSSSNQSSFLQPTSPIITKKPAQPQQSTPQPSVICKAHVLRQSVLLMNSVQGTNDT